MITLHNEQLTVTVNTYGAELQTITAANGTDYLWDGNPAYWKGRAPVLFPICGRLIGGEYRFGGKTYPMAPHGFAKCSEFAVESQSDTAVTLLLCDSEETRAQYPFAFEFRVTYALDGDTLTVAYAIHNPADAPLYASVGSHEAYACPEGFDKYEVVFETAEPLHSLLVGADGMHRETFEVEAPNGVLALHNGLLDNDSLVFSNLQSRCVTLRNRESGRGVKVAFDGAEKLVFWSKPDAPFMCVEPWCGFPDWAGFDGEFQDKEGMRRIEAGDTFRVAHHMTFLY